MAEDFLVIHTPPRNRPEPASMHPPQEGRLRSRPPARENLHIDLNDGAHAHTPSDGRRIGGASGSRAARPFTPLDNRMMLAQQQPPPPPTGTEPWPIDSQTMLARQPPPPPPTGTAPWPTNSAYQTGIFREVSASEHLNGSSRPYTPFERHAESKHLRPFTPLEDENGLRWPAAPLDRGAGAGMDLPFAEDFNLPERLPPKNGIESPRAEDLNRPERRRSTAMDRGAGTGLPIEERQHRSGRTANESREGHTSGEFPKSREDTDILRTPRDPAILDLHRKEDRAETEDCSLTTPRQNFANQDVGSRMLSHIRWDDDRVEKDPTKQGQHVGHTGSSLPSLPMLEHDASVKSQEHSSKHLHVKPKSFCCCTFCCCCNRSDTADKVQPLTAVPKFAFGTDAFGNRPQIESSRAYCRPLSNAVEAGSQECKVYAYAIFEEIAAAS